MFSEKKKKNQTPRKTSIPGDQCSQNASAAGSSKFCYQNSFKAAELVQPHTLLQSRLQMSSTLPHHTETKQKKIIASSSRIWLLSQFPQGPLEMPSPPHDRKQSGEYDTHIPKRGCGCFLIIQNSMDLDVYHGVGGWLQAVVGQEKTEQRRSDSGISFWKRKRGIRKGKESTLKSNC